MLTITARNFDSHKPTATEADPAPVAHADHVCLTPVCSSLFSAGV